MRQVIKNIEDYVMKIMADYDSGHDWWHIERVRKMALYINEKDSLADPFILELAALLHDTVDSKFFTGDQKRGYEMVGGFLDKCRLSDIKDQLVGVIKNVSYSTKNPSGDLSDPVLLIVQDADKLDAMGAIGIARAFNFGGFRNNPIYIPAEEPDKLMPSTIRHFYDKLLKLEGMMNTKTGKRLARDRHRYLEAFLSQFFSEWEFGTTLK